MRIVTMLWSGLVSAGAAYAVFPVMQATTQGAFAAQTEPHAGDIRQIEGLLNDQQAAWNKGAIDAFLQSYWHSPELTFSGSNGTQRGWDEVRARYLRNYPDRAAMGQLDFSGLEFRFLGSGAALVLGRWHLTRSKGDVGGVFTLVMQRLPEGWRIIHDHTSVVPEPEK